MRKKKNSDQTMTTSEVGIKSAEVEDIKETAEVEEMPKVRSGVFGIITIFSSLVLLFVIVFNPFHKNGQYNLDVTTDITVNLKLSSNEFLVISNRNICDGIGSVPGLKSSTIYAKSGSIDQSAQLGSGQLNDEGECEYTITIPTSDSFKGGDVDFNLIFPFAKSRIFTINVGREAPYKKVYINIPLD